MTFITEKEARQSAKRCWTKARQMKRAGLSADAFESQAARYEALADFAKTNNGVVDPFTANWTVQ